MAEPQTAAPAGAAKSLLGVLQEVAGLKVELMDEELHGLARTDERALGEDLVKRGLILREDLLRSWSALLDMPYWSEIKADGIDAELLAQIPIHFARRHKLVPVKQDEDNVWIALADPLALEALDDLCLSLGREIRPVLCPDAEVTRTINHLYHESGESAEQVMADLEASDDGRTLSELEESEDLLDATSDAPVIKLVNTVLSQAVRARASDIHIEPYQRDLKIRYRVDGVLYNSFTPPRTLHSAIVSRIKVMAQMNIAEKRLPQDGRIRIKIADRDFDIRVSTLPTSFGERVVLRLLDKTSVLFGLEEIGLSAEQMEILQQLITAPNGIILVTGPTGSGKTTTLYGALNHINSPDKNIITIEDPVEYQLPGIGQIQVNTKIELTFARGLRSIVRQDPDVILVGEIRDSETAEISIHAALTGHLVFSTLHTNNAAGAITRLIDMGIEPFLVSSSINAIVAQRLVRMICPNCKEAYRAGPNTLLKLGLKQAQKKEVRLYRGRGCDQCLNTGYKGRTGIFEFLVVDDVIKSLIATTADANAIHKAAAARGMKTLWMDGLRKVLDGSTTVEEVFRVTSI
jgi:general secretion pathway protein E